MKTEKKEDRAEGTTQKVSDMMQDTVKANDIYNFPYCDGQCEKCHKSWGDAE